MLLPWFEWAETLWLGRFVLSSSWMFPVVESIHLLALSLLGGAVLVVDLRLLGAGLKGRSVARIARDARPWLIAALIGMIVTGVPLFCSEAVKCYYSQAFWVKITTLPFAILFAFTIRWWVTQDESVRNTARRQKLVGALSIAMWFTVAAAGRWIGFS